MVAKKYIILFLLFFVCCNKQTRNTTTEKFDIATFEKNKINNEYNFVLKDGTKKKQISGENNYVEFSTPEKPKLFNTYKEYYKNGKLKTYIYHYHNNFNKLKKEYDETGKLIREINYDLPFKFTFEQLLELIKKEKDTIDLFDKNTSIARGSDETDTDWFITYRKNFGRREVIKVDGITGEILERSHYPHEDN